MAFGTSSKVMAFAMKEIALKTIHLGSGGDTVKVGLWGNSVTPTNGVTTQAHASYKGSGSTWSTTNEVATGSGYTQGGKTATQTLSQSTTHVKLKLSALSWTSASFTAYGCDLHDTTFTGTTPLVLAYLSFGGAQTVTSGTLTVTFSTTGAIEFNC
jgi:hypothetical protein